MIHSHSPIFVLGFQRSGTTLLSFMLDCHSQIAIPYESHFLISYYREYYGSRSLDSLEERRNLVNRILTERVVRKWDKKVELADVDLDRCTDFAGAVDQVFGAYARKRGKTIWGDKTPSYTEHIYALNNLFPTSRYIHIVRDGRDAALSLMEQYFGPGAFDICLMEWNRVVCCCRRMLAMLPADRSMQVRFEDLVAQPERELRRMADFLHLPFDPAMVNGYRNTAEGKLGDQIRSFHRHLSEPPSASQAYKWKRRLGTVGQTMAHEIAGVQLAELGYEPGITGCRWFTPRKALSLSLTALRSRLRSYGGKIRTARDSRSGKPSSSAPADAARTLTEQAPRVTPPCHA